MNAIRLHSLDARARARWPWRPLRGRLFVLRNPEIDRRHLLRVYRVARRSGVSANLARYLVVETAEVFAQRGEP